MHLSQHCQFLNITVFFSKFSDFVVGWGYYLPILKFRLRLLQRVILQEVFIIGREMTNVILTNILRVRVLIWTRTEHPPFLPRDLDSARVYLSLISYYIAKLLLPSVTNNIFLLSIFDYFKITISFYRT